MGPGVPEHKNASFLTLLTGTLSHAAPSSVSAQVQWGLNNGGEVVAVFLCTLIGGFQLGTANPLVTAINEGRAAARKLHTIIDRTPAMDTDPAAEGLRLPQLQGRIEFRNVAFRYPSRPDVPIFSEFNLVIEPGQKVVVLPLQLPRVPRPGKY